MPPAAKRSPVKKDAPGPRSSSAVPSPKEKPSPLALGGVEHTPTARLGGDTPPRDSSRGQDSKRGKPKSKGSGPKKAALASTTEEPSSSQQPSQQQVKVVVTASGQQKKIEYYTEELLSRKPLRSDARDALVKKCGPPVQEVNFVRNESKPPAGRLDDLAPSRHERVPPQRIVLMFNCFDASFSMANGDISTLPDAETCEVRSLTSGKVLGRVKLAPEKGTPIEDRMSFVDNWFVGSEHGLVHDGLQADGYIELRLDWRDLHDNAKVALLRVVPWLAYGCGEGARLAVRKPGATEGTSSTCQRPLRDDSVVVKRDGTDNELTVDPTPFTVVPSSNPRHPPGTRLLILYEGSCVDGLVEKWPESDLDIKEGSRHYLRVEGKLISGWITRTTVDGTSNLNKVEELSSDEVADADGEEAADESMKGVWILNRKKTLAMHSGCDPQNSEKVASLTNKMPIRILEARETEAYGTRCYVSTIPSQSSIMLTIALNEFNHSVQRFPSVAEYEAARANYCEDIVVREALVEDAITGNELRIKDQTLHISTATDAVDNARPIPPEWNVSHVLDLVKLLLVPSPNRQNGSHSQQPVLVRAGPGTGKTWMAKQAVFTLADKLLRGSGSNDGIRLVPIVVFVQRIIYLLREGDKGVNLEEGNGKKMTLLERYIQSVYSGKKMEAWQTMLMQAYDMRALVVLLDGVDEAAGLRDQIEEFVHKEVVPSGNRVLVTSRPEGVQLDTYSKTFVVMNLNPLTNEQQRRVINIQMQGNQFFDHLLSLGEVRKMLDDAYRKIGAVVRAELETLWGANLWQKDIVDGVAIYDPEQRQKNVTSERHVAEVKRINSQFLCNLDEQMRTLETPLGISWLSKVDRVCKAFSQGYDEQEFEDALLEDMLTAGQDEHTPVVQAACRLGKLRKKHEEADAAANGGTLAQKEARRRKSVVAEKDEQKKPSFKDAVKDVLAAAKGGGAPPRAAAAVAEGDKPAEGEGVPAEGGGEEGDVAAEAEPEEAQDHAVRQLWHSIMVRTDEIYMVHERMHDAFVEIVKKLVLEAGRDDAESKKLVSEIQWTEFKDPVRLHEKAIDTCTSRFDAKDTGLPESCISDVTRARLTLVTGSQIRDIVTRLCNGVQLSEEQMPPVWPSMRAEKAEADEAAAAAGAQQGPTVFEIKLMRLENKFDRLDPTHFRYAICDLEMTKGGMSFFCELEIHFLDILQIGLAQNSAALAHYEYFRKRLKGQVPEAELDRLLEEKLVFLVDATGIPVLLSLLVLIFTSGGEDLTKLPSNRIELYEIGIDSAVSKRLLPGGRTSTDALIHDWLRLFNLDRSAMTAALSGATEKKEREHRPTRKAALSMELSNELNQKKIEAESSAANKKKASEQGANKGDKKLLNLDAKEVYEVFRHGSHYLREAAKPEVQRTELNRIELSMPKKLVDTVMMLVNANLKMLLGSRAHSQGLVMLRHVAVSNQLAGRREFSAVHVATALLIDQVNTEGLTLWLHLNKEEAGLPLTKTLEAQTELAPAQYQFKHLSFQEGLFAQDLLIKAEAGWETWESDITASEFLNNPFMNNTCRIAAGYLGSRLAKRRPAWDFSAKGTRLSEVGLMALWLICENNDKLKNLDLRYNDVGAKGEDGIGLSRMLSTSTALVSLHLGNNVLGDLKGHIRTFGRGLSSNKTLTKLDVSSNRLLPDGIKVVCNALRTCTAMKDLNLSYNSPGREPALSGMLQMHPTLRSIGVVEKEPSTRSERTWWLDTRAKEAIGRALLTSPIAPIQYLQCDVFSVTDSTVTLSWTSHANCDAIVLAGVLRSNSVLKTLNVTSSGGEIGDYEREEIGLALISNQNGRVGYSDIYGLKEGGNPTMSFDLKDKEHIHSRRSFTLFTGLLRANQTITSLNLVSVSPEHIENLADALATNTTMETLILEQPSKTAPTAFATLPVQELNGSRKVESIDLFDAGGDQPVHKQACAVVGAILGASMGANLTIRRVKINPGGGSEGGAILEHMHRARRSSLTVLDLTNIGLGDRGGARFFESMLMGKCPMLKALHLGSNGLTDLAVGQLVVEVLRAETCNIETLDLNNNLLGAPVVTQAIKYNKSLTFLDINGNPIDDDGLAQMSSLLLENDSPKINSLTCAAFDIKTGSDQITIHTPTLGAGATRLMFGVLKFNTLIKVLNLKGRGIIAEAASTLAITVKINKTLKSIDLSENPVSEVSRYTGAKPSSDTKGLLALATSIKKSTSVETLTLEGGTLPVDQLKGDKKVRVLDLSRMNLSFISSIFMGTLLSGNSYMNEFVVHTNDLTPAGATIIVKQLSTAVKTLDIANVVRVEERSKGDKKADKKAASQAARADIPSKDLDELWSAVSELGWLEKLTMERDHFSELPSLGKLMALKNLALSNNKLNSLPDDVGLIRGLKSLTLHGNQLSELTAAVGDLEMLEKLDIRANKLLYLPTTISMLRNLKQLDVSENQLQALDPSICDLHAIEKAEFKDNPLVRPPAAIARQGIGAVRKYFQEICTSADLKTWGARAILLGNQDSGKSTLQRCLRATVSRMPFKPAHYEPTNQLAVESVTLGEGMRQVVLSIWDLAGRKEYGPGVQQYITDGALCILAVPAVSVALLKNGYEDYIGRWLSYLQLKAPKSVILPVLTKCDLASKDPALNRDRTPSTLENAAAAQLAWFNEQLDAFDATQPAAVVVVGMPAQSRLRIVRPVQCVASTSDGQPAMEAFKARLEEIVCAEPSPLTQVGANVNRNTFLTTVFVRALRDGREPIDSARAADIGYIPSTMSMELKLLGRAYVMFSDIRKTYLDEFVPALKMQATDQVLADTIKLLANIGEVLLGTGGIIFLQPHYLTRILKPLTDPRMGNRLWVMRTLSTQDALRALANKPPLTEAQRNDIALASEWLEQTGEIREELLPILWDQAGVPPEEYFKVASILLQAGIMYLAESTQRGRRWVLPMRLVRSSREELMEAWLEAVASDSVEVLRISIALGPHQPSGLIESLLSSCAGLGQVVKVSTSGAHLAMDMLPGVRDLLVEVRELRKPDAAEGEGSKEYELTLEVCGDKEQRPTQWASLMYIKGLAKKKLDDYPGLAANEVTSQGRAVFHCPACASQKLPDPTTWALEDVQARAKVCEKTQENVSLHSVTLGEFEGNPSPLILQQSPVDALELKFCGDKLRFGRPVEVTFRLHTLLGLDDQEEVDRLRSGGEHAIIDEFIVWDEVQGGWEGAEADANGWTDLDWLRYCAGTAAETRFRESDSQFKPKENGEEAVAKAIAEKQELLARQAKKTGIDTDRKSIDLNHFVKLPIAAAANLSRGHVLALRLFTSRMGHKINVSLHNGCAPDRPHPYPATAILLNDAVWKVRAAQIEERLALQRKQASLLENARRFKDEGDDEEAAKATQEAKEAEVMYKSLEVQVFWRGVFGLNPVEFKQRGSTEIGFMSLSKWNAAAKEHVQQIDTLRTDHKEDDGDDVLYLPLVPGWNAHMASKEDPNAGQQKAKAHLEIPIHMFKIVAATDETAPAALSFVSVFPQEQEYVYAPGVYATQGKINTEFMELGGEDVQYKVVEVVPILGANLSATKATKARGSD